MNTARLSLAYQPIVSATTGRLVAVEALLRERSERGAPLRLLSDSAESGDSMGIDRQVIELACAQLNAWMGDGLHVAVHVNVSAATAVSPDAREFAAWLSELDVHRSAITVELTETTRIRSLGHFVAFVDACRDAGFEVALDDFGCGYATLALLQRCHADIVKIDRQFVAPLPHDPWTRSIVRHLIALAHDLGMRVVGEGVETEAQAAWLLRLDCDEFQGYAIAPPMGGDELYHWALRRRNAQYTDSAL